MTTRTLQDIHLDITRITADLSETPEEYVSRQQTLASLWREVAQVSGGGTEQSLLRLAATLLADRYDRE